MVHEKGLSPAIQSVHVVFTCITKQYYNVYRNDQEVFLFKNIRNSQQLSIIVCLAVKMSKKGCIKQYAYCAIRRIKLSRKSQKRHNFCLVFNSALVYSLEDCSVVAMQTAGSVHVHVWKLC